MRRFYHVATALMLTTLAACSGSPTAPQESVTCVLVATPPMPGGWSASVWQSPVRGVACKIPATGINTIPR